MKKIVLLSLMVFMALSVNAQEDSSQKPISNIVYKKVPDKLNIKDKVIIQNKSPYYILQIVVAEVFDDRLEPLGSSTYIAPNETWELASFRNNELKLLRGKTIAIKAKGAKLTLGDNNRTNIWTPYGTIGVGHKELDPEIVNSIKPEDITYDFDAKLFEANHDLYIELFNRGDEGIMDF